MRADFFFFQAEDGIRDRNVTGVQTCALPILKGAFVRTLSHDEIRDLYEVREALEALAVRLGGPRVSREELEGFEARFRELRARGSRATATEVRPLGEELHQYLLKRAENAKLVDVLEHMREQVQPVWTMAIV